MRWSRPNTKRLRWHQAIRTGVSAATSRAHAFTGPGPPSCLKAMVSRGTQRLLPIVKSKSIESTNQSNPQSRSRPQVALIWMAPNSHTVLAASSYSYSQVAISTFQSPFGIVPVLYIRSIVFSAIQVVRRLRQQVTAEFLSVTRPYRYALRPS